MTNPPDDGPTTQEQPSAPPSATEGGGDGEGRYRCLYNPLAGRHEVYDTQTGTFTGEPCDPTGTGDESD